MRPSEDGRRSKNWLAGSGKGADLLGKCSSLLARSMMCLVAQHRLEATLPSRLALHGSTLIQCRYAPTSSTNLSPSSSACTRSAALASRNGFRGKPPKPHIRIPTPIPAHHVAPQFKRRGRMLPSQPYSICTSGRTQLAARRSKISKSCGRSTRLEKM